MGGERDGRRVPVPSEAHEGSFLNTSGYQKPPPYLKEGLGG